MQSLLVRIKTVVNFQAQVLTNIFQVATTKSSQLVRHSDVKELSTSWGCHCHTTISFSLKDKSHADFVAAGVFLFSTGFLRVKRILEDAKFK